MTEKKQDPPEEDLPEQDPPPAFISEANRIQIREAGSALDTFTGRILIGEDLDAYEKAQKAE